MSDRRDLGPLRLPPEREVTPQLRARVLHQAMRDDPKPKRSTSRLVPALAGLAAAAVVVGVVVTLTEQDDAGAPATGRSDVGQPVPGHHSIATVASRPVAESKVAAVKEDCSRATDVHANYRMTTERVRSPIGRIVVGAYADKNSPEHTQIFCTPFASLTSLPEANLATAQQPVVVVDGSRVQGRLPARDGDVSRSVYYDGAWFAVSQGVKSIEARLVVDGEAQPWHETSRTHAYVFVSTWGALTDGQSRGDVVVEYRAISVDNTFMPMPERLASTTVTPSSTVDLDAKRGRFPPIGD